MSKKDSPLSRIYKPREFISGWGAAVINITVTYPAHKIMFRQQLMGINFWSAFRQIKDEGLTHLYRGLMPPILLKTTSTALMFGTFDAYQTMIYINYPSCPVVAAKVTAAACAGWTEALLTPFERVQTLLQDRVYHDLYKNTAHAFSELKVHGVQEYFRGVSAILLRNALSNVIFFTLREELKGLMTERGGAHHDWRNIGANFVSGAFLGASISTLVYPLNVVKVKMQSQVGGDFAGISQTFHSVFNERDRSWRRMYLGAHVNFTRSLISWGIINAAYEFINAQFDPFDY